MQISNYKNQYDLFRKNNDTLKMAVLYSQINKLEYEDVYTFIRKTNCLNSNLFWKSDIIHAHRKLLKSDLADELIMTYFSREESYTNIASIISSDTPDKLVYYFRLSKAFMKDSHFESIKSLNKLLYEDTRFLRSIINDWKEKLKYYLPIVSSFTYEVILIHAVAYFEKYKRASFGFEQSSIIYRMKLINLCYGLNKLLSEKSKSQILISNLSINQLNEKIRDEMPPRNTPEGMMNQKYFPTEEISQEKKLLREAIDFFIQYTLFEHRLDLYCCGYGDIKNVKRNSIQILMNQKFLKHKNNDLKNDGLKTFFLNKALTSWDFKKASDKAKEAYELQLLQAVFSGTEYFKYLGLGFKIEVDGQFIQISDIFKLLYAFSYFLMPEGISVLQRNKPEKFIKIFEPDYLVFFDENELYTKLKKYYSYTDEYIKAVISFLTLDLDEIKNNIDLFSHPIIKISGNFIWLSSIYRDLDWMIFIYKKVSNESRIKHQDQSFQIEKKISEYFQKIEINATSSLKYKDEDGKDKGDIDVLVYQDKKLLVFELKTTFFTEDIYRNAVYNYNTFEQTAVKQLEKARDYIVNNYEDFRKNANINIDCELSELSIEYIIVSNIFEYDDVFIRDKFLKLSLFELIVILNNDLYSVLNLNLSKVVPGAFEEPEYQLKKYLNQNHPMVNQNAEVKTDKESCDLSNGKGKCDINDIILAIKENKVWKHLNEQYQHPEEILVEIGIYNEKEKFLIAN